MKLIIIIATIVVYTRAVSTVGLQHPSPINPDVIVAPLKPQEKITRITDPQEIIKLKKETKEPFYPTVLPKENEQLRTKHDHNTEQVIQFKSQEARAIAEKLLQKYLDENKPTLNTRNRRNGESYQNPTSTEGFQKLPTLPLMLKSTSPGTEQHKRDIPVPLAPKRHHPEESPKDINEEELLKNNKAHSEIHHVPQTQVHEQEYNSKTEQQNLKLLETNAKDTIGLSQQKRETSIPIVPNRESPTNMEPHKENKQVISQTQDHEYVPTQEKNIQQHDVKTHHITRTLAGHKHFDKEELAKTPQTIQLYSKKPTHHQQQGIGEPEEFQKVSNADKKEVKRSTENHPNKHNVEDVVEPNSSQKPIQHTNPIQKDHRGNELRVHDFTSSTTENPIIRRRPVPVSELFSRPHGNSKINDESI